MERKTALITGASTGIGYEMARCLAARGFDLVVVARDAKKLKDLAQKLRDTAKVTVIPLDLTAKGAALTLFRKTDGAKQKIDILVNNAGFGTNGEFIKLEQKRELQQIDLNIRALTELTHLFAAAMANRRSGKILNVASTAAFQPGPFMAVYYASKSYVLHFSEALSEELKKYGVQVSVLCPGPTKTEFTTTAGMNRSRLFTSPIVRPATAQYVAEYATKKFLAGKTIIIPGWMNKFLVFGNRLSPRIVPRKIAGYLNQSR